MPYGEDFFPEIVPTKQIDFEGGAWVQIRTLALAGDKLAATMDARRGEGGAPELEFNTGKFRLELLCRRIVAWSSPRKITRKAVEAMPEEMADEILTEIDALSGGRSDDEKKDSAASLPSSTSRAARRRGRKS